jgi:hypothetical protein
MQLLMHLAEMVRTVKGGGMLWMLWVCPCCAECARHALGTATQTSGISNIVPICDVRMVL